MPTLARLERAASPSMLRTGGRGEPTRLGVLGSDVGDGLGLVNEENLPA
jgi:hypothetical protein